ncbi:MAG TPA: hypothetical protein VLM87_11340 [Rubrivivax sp.]|nr:hypothetical protein [Rubrivivax sp.]
MLTPARAAITVQIGASGKTYASAAAQCANDPTTGERTAMVEAGLFNPKRGTTAVVSLDGDAVAKVSTESPTATVELAEGDHTQTPVFLDAGLNVIAAADASLSVDHYVREGGDGSCVLP